MIVSAVIDPSAFGPHGIQDELAKREAIAFLQGIITNGVLLDEPTRELIRAAVLEASRLSTAIGQKIVLLLMEIQKQHKKFIVSCDWARWPKNSVALAEKCCLVASVLKADVLVTQEQNFESIRSLASPETAICLLRDISESQYESSRAKFTQLSKPLEQFTPEEAEEYIGRCVKYASTLRFFDYRIIGAVSRMSKYVEGIRFFVEIWERWCIVGEPSSRLVEVYTVGNTHTQSGFLDSAEANSRLLSGIKIPLMVATRAQVIGRVKEDMSPPIFHARGFEARQRAFTIDPGFDAINTNGAHRRCLFKSDVAAESHFTDCRKLRDI